MRNKTLSAKRVLVAHQGCIPIYRAPFFTALSKCEGNKYDVFHGDAPIGSDLITASGPFDFQTVRIRNREFRIAGKPLIWQPIVWRFIRDYDEAVLGEEVKFLSSIAIIIVGRLIGRPVILWGFGYRRKDRTPGADSRIRQILFFIGQHISKILLRLVSGYLVYMPSGAEALERSGMPKDKIAIVFNTIDVKKEYLLRAQALERSEVGIRRDFSIESNVPVLLYFGRFLPAKRVDLLIDYARYRANAGRPVGVIIFGSGVESQRLQEQALGIDQLTFWSPDDLKLAEALRIASGIVIPGFVGLAITHGYAHGVPMITRENQAHSPEIEYLVHGDNGLILPEEKQMFFTYLDAFLDDIQLQLRLRAGAAATARTLSIDRTAKIFDDLVTAIRK